MAAAALLAGGGPFDGAGGVAVAAPQTGDGRGGIKLKRIAGFDQPVYVTRAPGRRNRKLLFVVEQSGVVRVLRGNRKKRQPFINIEKRVRFGGERGLLSIAFHPRYAKNRRFYLYYTDRQGDIKIAQFRTKRRNKTRAQRSGAKVIEIPHRTASNHNGGTAAFGPDGHLYIGTGDGGGGCDPGENAQSRRSLLGKILRIDPKRKRGYSVPAGNPFVGQKGARNEIFASGLRNPFRFSFDRASGTIAIGDVGQSSREEIDYERLRRANGANFGWDAFEGTTRFNPSSSCPGEERTPRPARHDRPIHQYRHSGSGHTGCSVTGGVVVRDRRLRSLYGRYVYADFCTGRLRSLIPRVGGARSENGAGLRIPRPTSFGTGRGQRLYATTLDGRLYRIKAKR